MAQVPIRNDQIKNRQWALIAETDIGSAVQSYTFSSLNGDVDLEYRIVLRFKNGANAGTIVYLRPNNDSAQNYGRQYTSGGNTTVSAGRASTLTGVIIGYASAINNESFEECLCWAKTGYQRNFNVVGMQDINGKTVGLNLIDTHIWTDTANNITSLVVYADQASGLGVGTHIELWARR